MVSCHYVALKVIGDASMVAKSNVRSLGILAKTQHAHGNIKKTSEEKEANAEVKRRCAMRLSMIMEESEDKHAFKREVLLCQYQEIHAQMKKNQMDFERQLRQGDATLEVKNPYKREFGDVIVNPHNFHFAHLPRPCDETENLLISIHSATQVFLLATDAPLPSSRNSWSRCYTVLWSEMLYSSELKNIL